MMFDLDVKRSSCCHGVGEASRAELTPKMATGASMMFDVDVKRSSCCHGVGEASRADYCFFLVFFGELL